MERNTKNYSLLIILLLLSIAGYAQKGVHGLGTSPIDTGVVARNFRVDSNVQLRKYATSDTNKVAGFDANGNIVLRTKSTGGGSTDSSIFATKVWVNNQGFLTSYTETDPVYTVDSNTLKHKRDSVNIDGYVTHHQNDTGKVAMRIEIAAIYDSLAIHQDTLEAHNARLITLENTGTTADLQDVTDNGNTTTNNIFANKFEATDVTDNGSPVAAFRVNRTLTTGVNASGHGFRDQTIFTRPTYAYNAFDAAVTMGNATSGYYDHWAAFQARGRFDGLDSMNDAYGFVSFYTVNTGKVRKVFNADAWDVTGTGTVDLLYGYHSQRLTKGSKNFAFRSEGKAWSSFGGNGCFGCDSITTPATDAAIFSDTSTTLHMYGIGTNDFPNIKFTYERTGTDTNYASIGIDQSRMFFYTPKTYQYRFYSVGALKFNVTSTGVRVGSTTSNATAKLHLDAGTATASTAPLKFTSGTLLSTPEAGAVEFDGTHYYGTIGSTRYQLDQQGGLSGSGTANYLVKYTGATSVGNSTIQDDGSNIGLGGAPNASYKTYNNGSFFNNGILYLLGGGSGGIRSTNSIYIDALNAGGASHYFRYGNNIDKTFELTKALSYINGLFQTQGGFSVKGNVVTTGTTGLALHIGSTSTYTELRSYNQTTGLYAPISFNAPALLVNTSTDDGSGREIQNNGQINSTDTIRTGTVMQEAGLTSVMLKTTSNGTHAAAVAGTDYLTRSTDTIIYAVAISDMTTALTTGTSKGYFRMPHAATLVKVKASVITASSSGTPTFDINEGGTSVLGTKLTIDANETTSETAASAATITDSALANDGIITYDIDTAGTGTLAAIIYLYVIKT